MSVHNCTSCGQVKTHKHLHDEAHGISGTHMSGSERFVCQGCGHTTHASKEAEARGMKFVLDKVT